MRDGCPAFLGQLGSNPADKVFAVGYRFQVSGVAAASNAAQVVEFKAWRNRPY